MLALTLSAHAGGAEHAVLHLLYARFWHKVLFDLGVVSAPEPFQRLVSQGMILGEARAARPARPALPAPGQPGHGEPAAGGRPGQGQRLGYSFLSPCRRVVSRRVGLGEARARLQQQQPAA